jgi:molybdopterin synthase catalytic subunit
MIRIKVQTEDFDVGAEIAALTAGRTDVGGVGCFLGTVRDNGASITGMTLEHYPGMTERTITRIAEQAMERWPLMGCTVIHRVGPLQPGENIVLVIAVSAHRQAALDVRTWWAAAAHGWMRGRRTTKRLHAGGRTGGITGRRQNDKNNTAYRPDDRHRAGG